MLHITEISNCLRQNLEESTGNVLEKNYVSEKKKKKKNYVSELMKQKCT